MRELYRNQRKPHGQAVSRVYREVLSVLLSFAVKYGQAYSEFACGSRRESAFLGRETFIAALALSLLAPSLRNDRNLVAGSN